MSRVSSKNGFPCLLWQCFLSFDSINRNSVFVIDPCYNDMRNKDSQSSRKLKAETDFMISYFYFLTYEVISFTIHVSSFFATMKYSMLLVSIFYPCHLNCFEWKKVRDLGPSLVAVDVSLSQKKWSTFPNYIRRYSLVFVSLQLFWYCHILNCCINEPSA